MFAAFGRGHHSNLHTEQHPVILAYHLWEYDMFPHADRQIAPVVKSALLEAAEIARAGQANIDQAGQKVVHAPPAQRHLVSDNLSLARLESSNGLFRGTGRRLLPRDEPEEFSDFRLILFITYLSDTDMHNGFFNARNRHHIFQRKFFPQSGQYLLSVFFLQIHNCHIV
mgnify:CR=1 FL=1